MDRFSRQRRALLLCGAGSAIFAVGGVVGARFVKSPAQLAAEVSAPVATTLTAQVQRRVLADTVVMRGTVSFAQTYDIVPVGADGRAVLTRLRVKQSDTAEAGRVLLEISGRPLFALRGEVPVFRDIRPGSRGADVAQLQVALAALGHSAAADPRGYFGAATKRAVTAFYEAIGYPVPTTGDTDQQAVEAARRTVRAAQRSVEDAQAALDNARAGAQPPDGGGPDAVAAARRHLDRAREDLVTAERDLDALVLRTGPMVPLSEMVFLPSFPARVVKVHAPLGATVTGPVLTLSTGDLVVKGHLNPAERGLLKPGLAVKISSESRAVTATGVVSAIGDVEQVEGVGRVHEMTVVPGARLATTLAGEDVRLTVKAAATAHEVLVVPLAAISAGADGGTVVTRMVGDLSERVTVRVGLSADGYAEVVPLAGALDAGDQVVIG